MSTRLQEIESNLSNDWKSRYLSLLKESDQKDKDWADEEGTLYKFILRLLISFTGKDAELDKSLTSMRDELRQIGESESRKSIISPVIDRVINFAQQDNSTAPDEVPSNKFLVEWIDKIDFPIAKKTSADSIKTSLARSLQPDQLREQLDTLAALVNRSLGSDDNRIALKGDDPLQQLLQNLTFPGELGAEVLGIRKRAEELENEQQRLEIIEQLVTLLKTHANRSATNDSISPDGVPVEALVELFEWLAIPSTHIARAEKIVSELTNIPDQANPTKILQDLAILINDLQAELQLELNEIQTFLGNVTSRLEEVESCFQKRSTFDKENIRQTQRLDTDIKADFQYIRKNLEVANTDNIRDVIETRLTSIEENMSMFIHSTEEQQQRWEVEVGKLNKRLTNMKSESIKLHQRIQEEYKKAQTDALTGVPNRLAYNEKIKIEFNRWQRYQQIFSICVVDVDKFKGVNDGYGHKAGDKVLRTIAEVCAAKIRKSDFFARYGGEEFVLLMPETDIRKASVVANNLREEIQACNFHYAGETVVITISCGLAQIRTEDSMDKLFKRADAALYLAKNNGRNRVEPASTSD